MSNHEIPFGYSYFSQEQYSHYPKHAAHNSNQYNSYTEISQPVHMHNGTNRYLSAQENIPAPLKAPADYLPSHKITTSCCPILWQLSQDVREWKFLATFLDVNEELIEETDQYTKPNETRDKSLKMLLIASRNKIEHNEEILREIQHNNEGNLEHNSQKPKL